MRPQIKAWLRPLVAVLCLLGYLGAATPMIPIGTSVVALLNSEHRVSVAVTKDGMSVVLRHDSRNASTSPTHVHCLASRALTLLAEPSGPDHADHVISLSSGNATALRAPPLSLAAPLVLAPSVSAFSTVSFLPAPVTRTEVSLLDIPPLALSVSVVRATVFLI